MPLLRQLWKANTPANYGQDRAGGSVKTWMEKVKEGPKGDGLPGPLSVCGKRTLGPAFQAQRMVLLTRNLREDPWKPEVKRVRVRYQG